MIGLAFLIVLNISPASSDMQIVEQNGKILFQVNETNEHGFTFRFRNNHKDIKVQSDLGLLEYNQKLEDLGVDLGEEFNVSVCKNGEVEGGNSQYSKEEKWLAKKFLAQPAVSIQNQTLVWDKIENADYYDVCYNLDGKEIKYTVSTNECRLDLLQGGIYNIYVTASSNSDFYLTRASDILKSVTVVHEILPFKAVYFSEGTKNLMVYSHEKLSAIEVCLGYSQTAYKTYTIVDINCVESGDLYLITCNLGFIYSDQTRVGALPKITDEYHKFTGNVYWA